MLSESLNSTREFNEKLDINNELKLLSTQINEGIKEANKETFLNIFKNTYNIIDGTYELSNMELATISSLQAFTGEEMFSYLETIGNHFTIDIIDILFYKLDYFFIDSLYGKSVPKDYIESFSRILLKIPIGDNKKYLEDFLYYYDEISREDKFQSVYDDLQNNLDILRGVLGK